MNKYRKCILNVLFSNQAFGGNKMKAMYNDRCLEAVQKKYKKYTKSNYDSDLTYLNNYGYVKFVTVADNSPSGILLTDLGKEKVIYYRNPFYYRLFIELSKFYGDHSGFLRFLITIIIVLVLAFTGQWGIIRSFICSKIGIDCNFS